MKLLIAVSACLLGYGEVGLWLKKQAAQPVSWVKLEGNPYLKWIEDYSGEDYQSAVKEGIGQDFFLRPDDAMLIFGYRNNRSKSSSGSAICRQIEGVAGNMGQMHAT
jgi:hypothetical protein